MHELTLQKEFRRGDASADKLQDVVDEVLAELQSSPHSNGAQLAKAAGLGEEDLAGAKVQVREGQQGVEPVLTTIFVTLVVTATSKVAESLWKDVLWPRLRLRWGWTAVTEELKESDGNAT